MFALVCKTYFAKHPLTTIACKAAYNHNNNSKNFQSKLSFYMLSITALLPHRDQRLRRCWWSLAVVVGFAAETMGAVQSATAPRGPLGANTICKYPV